MQVCLCMLYSEFCHLFYTLKKIKKERKSKLCCIIKSKSSDSNTWMISQPKSCLPKESQWYWAPVTLRFSKNLSTQAVSQIYMPKSTLWERTITVLQRHMSLRKKWKDRKWNSVLQTSEDSILNSWALQEIRKQF